ncbi:bacterial low temperature requirement A protein-domain-containing protein [Xylariales sp. AK1849]|nr:bacterial low temperature requirement A protein-domain-containing protein [Xylariales sp. AK1849]
MSQPSTRRTSIAAAPSGLHRRKPQEFLLPDGRKVLVALPEEAVRLRDKYAHHVDAAGAVQVEVVVHGSEAHCSHLRHVHRHHSAQQEALRAKHGEDFETWERTRSGLDEVARQLEGLSDHGAQEALNANFERFGYTSVLRTYGDRGGGNANGSGVVTPRKSSQVGDTSDGETSEMSRDWEDARGGRSIRLFQRPVIKQYFHRGLLWRASELTKVMSFELFFDLLYVGILDINGEHASEHPDGSELLRFVITFVMSWKIWSDVQQTVSWFETDDVLQRGQILFLIACLLGFTTNMVQTFSEEYDTYVQLVSFYLAARLFQACYFGITAFMLPLIKGTMLCQIIIILIPSALWIASTHVDMPSRLGLIFVALALDIMGFSFIVIFFRYSRTHDTPSAKRIERFFEFYPAVNIEHRVERTNAFVSLVIGYGIVGLLYQNAGYGINAFLGKAVMGLIQGFIFNWIYFEVDGENIHVHAIRRNFDTAWIWQLSHLPFICAYVLAAAAMSKLVVAADHVDADAQLLTETYKDRSEPDISLGLRFFYCAGLGVALFFMGLISLSHVHKIPDDCHVPKRWRLVNRAAVCVIFFCLPAAESLNSLQLISITMSLMLWVLCFEIWGRACPDDSFVGKGACTYSAECSKRRLEEAMKEGGQEVLDASGFHIERTQRRDEVATIELEGWKDARCDIKKAETGWHIAPDE